MSYFSRLTDIVTCNLTELLAREADPAAALEGIIAEMQEGLAGAKRRHAPPLARCRLTETGPSPTYGALFGPNCGKS